jgi:HK97 family phage portal protein
VTAHVFNLEARAQGSRVLSNWLATRPMAAERAGVAPNIQAAGENAVETGLSADQLAKVLGATSLTSSGVNVTADIAMRQATVYGCVQLLTGAVASLPLDIFERVGAERKPAPGHDLWWMLNEQANDEMSSFTAWQCLVAGKLFEGDGFGQILRASPYSNRIIGWKPWHPLRVQPFRDTDGTKYFRMTPEQGAQFVLDAADVIQLPSLGYDGLTSPAPIVYAAREAVGAALAAEQYSGRFFNGGAAFDYALKTPNKLGKEQLDTLYHSLSVRARQSGATRAPLVLTGGLEPATLSMNLRDAEIVALRVLSDEQICRALGVPPHMVGITTKTTSWGTGLEEQGASFVRYTLQNLLTPIAQEFNRRLWPTRARYFVEHTTAALERGNLKARFEAYRIALGRAGETPFMSTAEIRRDERMGPGEDLQPNPVDPHAKPTDPAAG